MKVVFMGTPDFAVNVLQGLIDNYEVVGVVSQPDKKVGRKQILTNTPVKELALKYNIPVFQPVKIRNEYDDILALNPDKLYLRRYLIIQDLGVLMFMLHFFLNLEGEHQFIRLL